MVRSLLCSAVHLILLAAASGCEHSDEPPLRPDDGSAPGPSTCALSVAPDEALAADVTEAAERWSAATGCTLEVSDAGVPVVLVTSIVRPDGTEAPGMTSATLDRVEINVRVRGASRKRSVLHELGHVLGGRHVVTSGVLSGEKGYAPVIDGASLASVCERLDCPAFSPEAP